MRAILAAASGHAGAHVSVSILVGDCRDILKTLPDGSVQCVVTSPPYFGLRDYGVDGQIGLEPSPIEFVATMVEVFRAVRRVIRDDGTVFLNLGDSYAQTGGHGKQGASSQRKGRSNVKVQEKRTSMNTPAGLKAKDLIGIPFRVAFALQDDGWYLRQEIIWAKPNPMPESVLDRCTKAHEYVFLLTKSPRYLFNADAIAEPRTGNEDAVEFRGGAYVGNATFDNSSGGVRTVTGNKRVGPRVAGNKSHKYVDEYDAAGSQEHRTKAGLVKCADKAYDKRNRRSVWTIGSEPFKESHFATMPTELAKLCILAGSNRGDTVLDPFGGAGTTALVADRLERMAVMVELNPTYAEMARARIVADQGPLEAALRPVALSRNPSDQIDRADPHQELSFLATDLQS